MGRSEIETAPAARRGLHFIPEFNFGHVLTIVALVMSALAAWFEMRAQVREVARDVAALEKRFEREQIEDGKKIDRLEKAIADGFQRIFDKLDGKQDKRPGGAQ